MSFTDPNPTTARNGDTDRGDNRRRDPQPRPVLRETKPSPKTTELWLALAGVAVLAIIYIASDNASLTLWRTCLLATVLGAAYIVSRGIAKAGSHDDGEVGARATRR